MKIAVAVILGLMITAGCTPVSQNTTPPSQNATLPPNEQNLADATKGTIGQAQVSWAHYYGSLGDLAQAADLIVKGKVVGIARSYVDKGIPFTDFDVEADAVLKGSANSTIQVKQTGGISDDPALVPGKTYFLFLNNYHSVLGGPRFEVRDGLVYSLSVLYPDRIISDLGVAGTPLVEFTQQIKKSLESK